MPSLKSKLVQLGMFKGLFHDISDDDLYFRNLHDQMEFEFPLITSMLIPSDGVCLDIGANIGIKTFVMAKQAKDGAVLAIEGSPRVYEALCLNIKNNELENVCAENVAVTEVTSTVRFVENSAWGYLVADDDKSTATEVPGITLSDLINNHFQHRIGLREISFVKIDTEGHEYKILKNAAPVLKKFNPWIYFEFNSYALITFGDTNPKEFLKWVFSNFSYVFRVDRKALGTTSQALLHRFDSRDLKSLLHQNIVSNGSVDDFLVTNRESALNEVRHLLLPGDYSAQSMLLQNQTPEVQAQDLKMYKEMLEAIKGSRSWRLTAPFRFISGLRRRFFNKFSKVGR